uniref:Uncharacterized protein n=1 Tax=Leptospirillum sp. Group II '5-way CG' TaxID=419541 RepID=B6APA0_9BACT|nr:MAG: Hypothetical protein CGL2_11226004 [Leptospirillum sp. Group II '5-way CG']
MNPLSIFVGLLVSAMLTAAGLPFVLSEIHSSRLSALEADIGKIQAASASFGKSQDTYTGISCPALVQSGFWPTGGCSGSDFDLPDLPNTTVTVTAPTPETFEITATTTYYTASDLSMACNAWGPKSNSCTPRGSTLSIVFQ